MFIIVLFSQIIGTFFLKDTAVFFFSEKEFIYSKLAIYKSVLASYYS